jgi:hypothetical protein
MMKKKRTRIVPSLVVTASFVGVIPACALGACGGTTTSLDGGGGVADSAFGDVKDAQFFNDGVAADAFKNDVILGVAAVAMCCFDSGPEGG